MARRSLKPQLNQIRAWVRQGRTDAWIAHQLEISASELREFRSQHDLSADDEDAGAGEADLRDEIEAEIEAAAAEAETGDAEEDVEEESADAEDSGEEEPEDDEKPDSGRRSQGSREGGGERRDSESKGQNGEGGQRRRRRRGRRGGRGRRRKAIEATFDHGENDGYGLWLDPAVQDNPVYAQHWAGKRDVTVSVEPDQIVIRRAGSPEQSSGGGNN